MNIALIGTMFFVVMCAAYPFVFIVVKELETFISTKTKPNATK